MLEEFRSVAIFLSMNKQEFLKDMQRYYKEQAAEIKRAAAYCLESTSQTNYSMLHFIKISTFSFFLIVYLSLYTTTIIYLLSLFSRYIRKIKRLNTKWIVLVYIYKYGYYSNYIFLHKFAWPNASEFWVLLAKMWYFFYYTSIDASALRAINLCKILCLF